MKLKSFSEFLFERKPAGAPDWNHSDAPDAHGKFKELNPKDLAAWLIKTRKGDAAKIQASLTQQIVFRRNKDPKYAEKMEKTRDEVRKQLKKNESLNEADPKYGTGKKPPNSGRRLYTDENPADTVNVKFRTKEDIVDTLNKAEFKEKPHVRQSQIINLIHQRVRAAHENAKDDDVKKRLKRALDYITDRKEASKEKTKRLQENKKPRVGRKRYADDPPEIGLYSKGGRGAIKGTGYSSKEKAEFTIKKLDELLKKGERVWAMSIATTMESRAKKHKHQTDGMRDAMKIFRTWIDKNKKK